MPRVRRRRSRKRKRGPAKRRASRVAKRRRRRSTRAVMRYTPANHASTSKRVVFTYFDYVIVTLRNGGEWGLKEFSMSNPRAAGNHNYANPLAVIPATVLGWYPYWNVNLDSGVHRKMPQAWNHWLSTPDADGMATISGQYSTWRVDKSRRTFTLEAPQRETEGQNLLWGIVYDAYVGDGGAAGTITPADITKPFAVDSVANCIESGMIKNITKFNTGYAGPSKSITYNARRWIKKAGTFTDATQLEGKFAVNPVREARAGLWIGSMDHAADGDPILAPAAVTPFVLRTKHTFHCTLIGGRRIGMMTSNEADL